MPVLPETLAPAARHSGGFRSVRAGFVALLKDRNFLRYAGVQCASAISLFSYITMSSIVFQHQYGLSVQQFAFVFASNAVGLVVVGRLVGAQAERFGARRLVIAGSATGLASAIALMIAVTNGLGLIVVVPLLWVAISTSGVIGPISQVLALTRQGERAGTASAMLGLSMFLVGAAAGPMASLGGATPTKMAAAVVVGLSTALAIALFRRPLVIEPKPGS